MNEKTTVITGMGDGIAKACDMDTQGSCDRDGMGNGCEQTGRI